MTFFLVPSTPLQFTPFTTLSVTTPEIHKQFIFQQGSFPDTKYIAYDFVVETPSSDLWNETRPS